MLQDKTQKYPQKKELERVGLLTVAAIQTQSYPQKKTARESKSSDRLQQVKHKDIFRKKNC
jgi:hypothetical protein